MKEAFLKMPQEQEQPKTYELQCIAPYGLGFGDGTISTAERHQEGAEHPVSPEQLQQAMEVIIANKHEIIVPVDEYDDGCGDGRPASRVFQIVDSETGEVREYRKSKNRAKIFGGGLQVAASMWRAVAGTPSQGETTLGDRRFISQQLTERGLQYGAHTDQHAHGDSCGCGAIDNYDSSTQKSGKYAESIIATLPVFYDRDVSIDEPGVAQAFAVRAAIAEDKHYLSNASGRETMEFIEQDGAVVKQLAGTHFEEIVLCNEEAGTTVDQKKLTEILKAAGLPEDIHVFVIDVWRGRMYADAVADIAVEQGVAVDREAAQEIALADFFVNQLSVSATLTDGSQPVLYNKAT